MLFLTTYLLAISHASVHLDSRPASTGGATQTSVVWTGYGGNAQHTAISMYSPSGYGYVAWSAPLDANPPYSGGELLIHYGSASLTGSTIVTPYRSSNTWEFVARNITSGQVTWTYLSNYKQPSSGFYWTPPVDGTLLPDGAFAGPLIGGGVFIRPKSDQAGQAALNFYPFPANQYTKNFNQYTSNVFVVTPMTADSSGNVYYGIRTYGAVPNGMTSCFVKVSESGTFTTYTCAPNHQPTWNAGPTLSNDGATIYMAENVVNSSESHLIALSTSTMQKTADVILKDMFGNQLDAFGEESSASPLVGPDGDVYFGAMFGEYDRGWLLHYDGNLNPKGAIGAFGWDDTPSVVPSSAVPGYTGSSSYLLCCKYNHYIEAGLPGNNMVAVLDPNDTAIDPYDGVPTMKPVLSVLGVTHDSRSNNPSAVREWCINSAAVDVPGKSIVLNSEDGAVYKFDLTTGTLTSHLQLTGGIGEAYTPTVIAKDGTVFAVDSARIYAIRAKPSTRTNPMAANSLRSHESTSVDSRKR